MRHLFSNLDTIEQHKLNIQDKPSASTSTTEPAAKSPDLKDCGNKTFNLEIRSYLSCSETKSLDQTKISERSVRENKNDLTCPHSGTYYPDKSKTYRTSDIDNNHVEVKITDLKPIIIHHSLIKTSTMEFAFNTLLENIPPINSNNKNDFTKIKESILKHDYKEAPKLSIINGDVKNQITLTEKNSTKMQTPLVIINASQLNYQEQLSKTHNIRTDIKGVYFDNTFGPGILKSQQGGPEFLAHRLSENNQTEFYGAFRSFFQEISNDFNIHAVGGYYESNISEHQWDEISERLCKSAHRVESFRWVKQNSTIIYQTGAINSANSTAKNYNYLHKQAAPPYFIEFLILFFQYRNVLLYETQNNPRVLFHTTEIGGGCFSNTKGVAILALQAALISLPKDEVKKIECIFIGTYGNRGDELRHELSNIKNLKTNYQVL